MHGHDILRIKPLVEIDEIQKAPHHENGPGQQDERERDLGGDEEGAQTPCPRAGRGSTIVLLQRVEQVGPRSTPGRRHARGDAGQKGDGRGEQERPSFEMDVVPPRHPHGDPG